jgi:hypothetical protein
MAGSFFLLACALAAESATDLRPLHEVQQELSLLLKQEAQATDGKARAAVVRRMCELHGEIVRDSRFATSDVLKQYRGQLWSRLTKVRQALKQQFSRELAGNDDAKHVADLATADEATVAATASLGDSLAILEQSQNGPGQWAALGGGPVAADWGPDLVELIERTINPAFWDVAGGLGTIVYYRPLRCLVVRATSEVHGQVGGIVGELRK